MNNSELEPYSTTSNQHLDYMDQVEEAIDQLSKAEIVRLQRFGELHLLGFRARTPRNGNDCLQEAITRTLEGKRIWNPVKINFFTHLLGVIRSICDHWRKQTKRGLLIESLMTQSAQVRSQEHHPYYEVVDRLRELFAEDQEILQLIELHLQGLSGPEIQAQTHICQREYETRMKRLYRKARKSKVV